MTDTDTHRGTDMGTGALVLEDGTVFEGVGIGAVGVAEGEVCFNTAMTGYQEILTDPSYAGQILVFTFPHIGNTGVNAEDVEAVGDGARLDLRGVVLREAPGAPSSWRASGGLEAWLMARGIVGLCGVDTRALTHRIREGGMARASIAHAPEGEALDMTALRAGAQAWAGIEGMELARAASVPEVIREAREGGHRVVVMDYGTKGNILRLLERAGCAVDLMPADTAAADVLQRQPDGILLSNGPGDPAATGAYATETLRQLVASGTPIFGICLGHQLLALALGAQTEKMRQGHHGANHPVKDLETGKVEIVSMNHGFTVARGTLPKNAIETHASLFDGSLCGLRLNDAPVFSVQFHPEASPGPQDSHYLFTRFIELMEKR